MTASTSVPLNCDRNFQIAAPTALICNYFRDYDTATGRHVESDPIAHAACRADFSVRCFRLPRLVDELTRYAALQRRSALFKQLARVELLVVDDFGLSPLADQTVRDLLEVLDDRYDRASTMITSQLPLERQAVSRKDR